MQRLVDMHVHLLAGLDDGPSTLAEALEMARQLCAEGATHSVALAHQNDHWVEVTPNRIRQACQEFREALAQASIPLEVFPCAEVMVRPETEEDWQQFRLLTVADQKDWLLVEMPHNLFVDLRPLARKLRAEGVRLILAHPEKTPELLHDSGRIEDLIELGCLVQISSKSVTAPANPSDAKALRNWLRRGIVHLFGSDGHSPIRRRPRLAEAAAKIRDWAGAEIAERVCYTTGLSILRGQPVFVPPPTPIRRSWFSRLVS